MTSRTAIQWLRKRLVRAVCVAIAIGFAGFLLFANPISHDRSYTLYLGSTQPAEETQSICPKGATAHVWFDPYAGSPAATFSIYDPSGALLWTDHAVNGSTTLSIQKCGDYGFGVSPSESLDVVILVAWSAPLL